MDINKYIYLKYTSLHGSIQHYFHFFYGVLIPLILEQYKYYDCTFLIDNNLGPMLKILLELPLDIKFTNEIQHTNYTTIHLIPMDIQPIPSKKDLEYINKKWASYLTFKDVNLIKNYMNSCIIDKKLIMDNYDYDIVIIERLTNKSYKSLNVKKNEYENIMKTSGSERREILNHEMFVKKIKELYCDKKIINVSLEIMSIFEQYKLFNNAKFIIAQHGAALSNIVFMNENTTVIEIISKEKLKMDDWFKPISKICKINHYQYITLEEKINIDLNDFELFIKKIIPCDLKYNIYTTKFKNKLLNVLEYKLTNDNVKCIYKNLKTNIKKDNFNDMYDIICVKISENNIILEKLWSLLNIDGYMILINQTLTFDEKVKIDCFLNLHKSQYNIFIEFEYIILEKNSFI